MTKTRAELDAVLDGLDSAIPRLKAECPDEGEFWSAFAGMADDAFEHASARDFAYVSERVDAILAKHGLPSQPDP